VALTVEAPAWPWQYFIETTTSVKQFEVINHYKNNKLCISDTIVGSCDHCSFKLLSLSAVPFSGPVSDRIQARRHLLYRVATVAEK